MTPAALTRSDLAEIRDNAERGHTTTPQTVLALLAEIERLSMTVDVERDRSVARRLIADMDRRQQPDRRSEARMAATLDNLRTFVTGDSDE